MSKKKLRHLLGHLLGHLFVVYSISSLPFFSLIATEKEALLEKTPFKVKYIHDKIMLNLMREAFDYIEQETRYQKDLKTIPFGIVEACSPYAKLIVHNTNNKVVFPQVELPQGKLPPVELRDFETGRLLATLKGFSKNTPLAVSPGGKTIALVRLQNCIELIVFKKKNNRMVQEEFFIKTQDPVQSIPCFSPDGGMLIVELSFFKYYLLDCETLTLTCLSKKEKSVLSYSPNGDFLVVGNREGKIYLYNARSGEFIESMFLSDYSITALACSPQGDTIFVGDAQGRVGRFNRNDKSWLTISEGFFIQHLLLCSPDGKKIVVRHGKNSWGDRGVVFDSSTGKKVCSLPEEFSLFAFSPDSEKLYGFKTSGTQKNPLCVCILAPKALGWLNQHVTMFQALFISKAYKAKQEGRPLTVRYKSEGYKALMSIDDQETRSTLVILFDLTLEKNEEPL